MKTSDTPVCLRKTIADLATHQMSGEDITQPLYDVSDPINPARSSGEFRPRRLSCQTCAASVLAICMDAETWRFLPDPRGPGLNDCTDLSTTE